MKHLAVARLWFEANSFSPRAATLRDLQVREWVAGPGALVRYRDAGTELGGLARWLDAHPDWRATVIRAASAQPAGPLTEDAFATWMAEVEAGLSAGGFDAVYLSLHGACRSASDHTADLTILRRVRAIIGATPLGASFDLHGDIAPGTADLLDVASVYRTHPHIDMAETAARVLDMLDRTVAGTLRPVMAAAKVKRVLHSLHMRTEAGPMAEIEAAARAAEAGPIADVAVFGGFAWGDTPHAGPTVLVTADADREAAQAVAGRIAGEIAARAPRFDVSLPGPQDALAEALAAPPGLVALLDPADNPFSGGAADTPLLLRTLLDARLDVPAVFAFLHDPDAVQAAIAAGVGGRFRRAVGARLSADFGAPVRLDAEVERLTDGRYVNEGPMEHGAPVDFGPTALLRVGALRIVLASECQAPVDPAFFALHGIDLGATRLLAVKGKNHFRAAFASRCVRIVDCECPGPAATDLTAMPFRHVPMAWRRPGKIA